jgi:hypothetical protein
MNEGYRKSVLSGIEHVLLLRTKFVALCTGGGLAPGETERKVSGHVGRTPLAANP